QRRSLGKRHLDDVLVRLSRAHNAAVGKHGSPWRCRLGPLQLFDDLRVCLVYEFAHFRQRLPPPVPKFLDLLVHECSGRGRGLFHLSLQLSQTSRLRSAYPSTSASGRLLWFDSSSEDACELHRDVWNEYCWRAAGSNLD